MKDAPPFTADLKGNRPWPHPAPVITGPCTHKNLDVFLIHGDDLPDISNYITLEEALDQKKWTQKLVTTSCHIATLGQK